MPRREGHRIPEPALPVKVRSLLVPASTRQTFRRGREMPRESRATVFPGAIENGSDADYPAGALLDQTGRDALRICYRQLPVAGLEVGSPDVVEKSAAVHILNLHDPNEPGDETEMQCRQFVPVVHIGGRDPEREGDENSYGLCRGRSEGRPKEMTSFGTFH